MTEHYSRRKVLALTGALGGVALAGCSSGSGPSNGNGGETTTNSPTDDSGGSGESWEETSTVEMTDSLKFKPKRIQVSEGTTVTWKNVGSIAHSVTAYEEELPDGAAYFASGDFDSQQAAVDNYPDKGAIPKGESYEYTFETTGTSKYFCIPHEMNGMIGYVKVS